MLLLWKIASLSLIFIKGQCYPFYIFKLSIYFFPDDINSLVFISMLYTTRQRIGNAQGVQCFRHDSVWFTAIITLTTLIKKGHCWQGLQTNYCSLHRKCQHFPTCYWLICAVFSGRGFLGITNTKVNPKMLSLPVFSLQEVPVFSSL